MNITLTLITGLILLIILGFYLEEEGALKSNLSATIYGILLLLYFVGGILFKLRYQESIQYEEEHHKYYIESLGNETNTEGNIGLFSGSIEGVDYYFFFTETKKKA